MQEERFLSADPRREAQVRAYEFLQQRLKSSTPFRYEDLTSTTGWARSSAETYVSKQLKDFLERVAPGQFLVRPEFDRVTLEQFLELTTQTRRSFTDYKRLAYDHVVTYEFLLPLTREEELRQALDALFYVDTVRHRLQEIGLDLVAEIIERKDGESDSAYVERLCQIVSEMFGGYSINHVSGRFRLGDLVSRARAGELLAQNQRYLIDETTAVVRFIIPVKAARREYGEDPRSIVRVLEELHVEDTSVAVTPETYAEIRRIRALFFLLFVEAVVRNVSGEAEIWLLETGHGQRLYVWERIG